MGAASDLKGQYVILNVPPGVYTLRARMIGYQEMRVENVMVSIDFTTKVDFQLQPTVVELGKAVTVVAERPMIIKDLTASTAVVKAEEIKTLPVTEIYELLALQAGYIEGHIRGGRRGEIAYWIDGIPVTDLYDGSTVVDVDKGMVQELQMISGAYNAEYGQAMSGIINIVTKEGSNTFGGFLTTYFGDHLSNHDRIFLNIGNLNPIAIHNFEGSLHGPIVRDKFFYYLSGRYIYFDGWLYGKRRFNPHNIAYTDSVGDFHLYRDPEGRGDEKYVPMNWSKKSYFQGKLVYKFSPAFKLSYNYILDKVTYRDYDRSYKYNPDGDVTRYRTGYTNILKLTHTLSSKTFYTLGISYFSKSYRHYLYKDISNPRYVHPILLQTLPYSFRTGGTNNQHFYRSTTTLLTKIDFTSQLTNTHQIKTGVEFRRHRVYFEDITLRPVEAQTEIDLAHDSPFIKTRIMDESTIYHSRYVHHPIELSGYIQDKMEFKSMIVNAGLRVDYFDPDGVVLADETDPSIYNPIKPQNRYHDLNGNGIWDRDTEPEVTLAERMTYWYKEASPKLQISPRLGVAFPITARGVIYFSYGHFFQIPRFERLYQNPDFELGSGTGNQGVIGNADLKPEKTVNGEIGLQQQLTDDIAMSVTAYFRDIRNLTGTRAEEIVIFGGSAKYSKLDNSDFGFIRGLIISLNKRFSGGFSATLDYTYQMAKGSASDPEEARNALAGGALPEVHLVPLNWDRRHTLNATFSYVAKDWGFSVIAQYGTGMPYTPRRSADITSLLVNSQRKPNTYNVDLRAYKDIKLRYGTLSLFLRVFNLFDTLNEVDVYDDTGRAGFTTDERRVKSQNPPELVNTIEDWFINPTHYSEPRRVEFGMTYSFEVRR